MSLKAPTLNARQRISASNSRPTPGRRYDPCPSDNLTPWASPAVAPDPKDRVGYSPEIWAGRLDVDDVIRPIYKEAGEALGREFPYPEGED